MTNHARVNVGCLLVGEYVDEAELPTNLAFHRGEVVRPQVVGSFLDLWARDDGIKEFTVLFGNGHHVVVRGHYLKYFPPTGDKQQNGTYGVVVRTGGEEMLVGLFGAFHVRGIFHGEVRLERQIA